MNESRVKCVGIVKVNQSAIVSKMSLMLIFLVFRILPLFLLFLYFSIILQGNHVQRESVVSL